MHASDLRTLSPSCHVSKALSNAPSSLQFAYVQSEDRHANPFVDLSGMLSKRCGSRTVSHAPDFGELDIDAGMGKHVISISLPPLENGESGDSRKSSMASHGVYCNVSSPGTRYEPTLQNPGSQASSPRLRPCSPTTS